MKVLYGQRGQPVGSVESDAVFDATGRQIAFMDGALIFKFGTGEFIGSLVEGVIYNANGAPQAFQENCQKGIRLQAPAVQMASPAIRTSGEDVSHFSARSIPDFLIAESSKNFIDGWFQ
jgi:hypothetical protein